MCHSVSREAQCSADWKMKVQKSQHAAKQATAVTRRGTSRNSNSNLIFRQNNISCTSMEVVEEFSFD